MRKLGLTSSLGFLLLVLVLDVILAADYSPTDTIFLNCGGPPHSTDTDGRNWTSDIGSSFVLSATKSLTSPAATQKPSVPVVPYMTGRIFQSEFTYSFPVASGRKFLRLHFYPGSYNGLNASDAIFAVSAGGYTVLRNFSAAQTVEARNVEYVMKEFSINVPGDFFIVTFTPSPNASNSYAFINGIEVVSHPDIYSEDGTELFVGQSTGLFLDNYTALENVYRLNVGGRNISPSGDTGLFRSWLDDTSYLLGALDLVTLTEGPDPDVTVAFPSGSPSYIAPLDVYTTMRSMGPNATNQRFNLTWVFTIDSGFCYLVRLHFCELKGAITKVNQRQFTVFLHNEIAELEVDPLILGGGNNGVPLHRDYVVVVPRGPAQQLLRLDLHRCTANGPQDADPFLNGVEIFKINDTFGNLAGPYPDPLPQPQEDGASGNQSSGSGKSHKATIGEAVGGGIGALLVVGLLICLISRSDGRLPLSLHANSHAPGSRSDGRLPVSLHGNSHAPGSRSDGQLPLSSHGNPHAPGSQSDGQLPLSSHGNPHASGSGETNTAGSYTLSLPPNLCRHFRIAEIKAATNNFDQAFFLGQGGFGKVYRGEIDSGTKVAIKRGTSRNDQRKDQFQNEIEVLSKLRHHHLVSLLGCCEENSELILVYDYMAYGTLREHLYNTQKPPLPWKQRLEICIGAARGLHYLHTGAEVGTIIHRDVKTSNILLDEEWVAKVSDLGLSKTTIPSLDHTLVSTEVKGSFGYLDPEYFKRSRLTEKSDVYSFGVVLLEMVGARPVNMKGVPDEQQNLVVWAWDCYEKHGLKPLLEPYLKGKFAPESLKKFAETAMKCISEYGTDRPTMGEVVQNLELALKLQESAGESGKGMGDMDGGVESSVVGCMGKDPESSSY